jgi:hypothetical protein
VDPETDSKSVVLAKATLVMEVGTTPGLGVAEASNTRNLLALSSAIWDFLFRQRKSARLVPHGVRFGFHPTAASLPVAEIKHH